ncbi:MAG: DUF1207 domain-containing protein [bacterium]
MEKGKNMKTALTGRRGCSASRQSRMFCRCRFLSLFFSVFCFLTSDFWLLTSVHAEWFPQKKRVFTPFLADPTQPAYIVRLTGRNGKRRRADVNMGDEFGIISRPVGENGKLQLGLLGGVEARFDISRMTNDLEIADYSVALPLDYLSEDWSFRTMCWHTSSHLGDDYIKRAAGATELRKNVRDEIRAYASWRRMPWLRIYSGLAYAFNVLPGHAGRKKFQAGIEVKSGISGNREIFAASDLRALERSDWRPAFLTRVGWRIGTPSGRAATRATVSDRPLTSPLGNNKGAGSPGGAASGRTATRATGSPGGANRRFSIFVEFFSGRLEYLGFPEEKETHWSLGMSFEM